MYDSGLDKFLSTGIVVILLLPATMQFIIYLYNIVMNANELMV